MGRLVAAAANLAMAAQLLAHLAASMVEMATAPDLLRPAAGWAMQEGLMQYRSFSTQ